MTDSTTTSVADDCAASTDGLVRPNEVLDIDASAYRHRKIYGAFIELKEQIMRERESTANAAALKLIAHLYGCNPISFRDFIEMMNSNGRAPDVQVLSAAWRRVEAVMDAAELG